MLIQLGAFGLRHLEFWIQLENIGIPYIDFKSSTITQILLQTESYGFEVILE